MGRYSQAPFIEFIAMKKQSKITPTEKKEEPFFVIRSKGPLVPYDSDGDEDDDQTDDSTSPLHHEDKTTTDDSLDSDRYSPARPTTDPDEDQYSGLPSSPENKVSTGIQGIVEIVGPVTEIAEKSVQDTLSIIKMDTEE